MCDAQPEFGKKLSVGGAEETTNERREDNHTDVLIMENEEAVKRNGKDETLAVKKEQKNHSLQINQKKENKIESSPKNDFSSVDSSGYSSEQEIKQQPPAIDNLEKISSDKIIELSTNEIFFHSPLKHILSYISMIDFSSIDDIDDRFDILKKIIENTINAHSTEKETLLIMQYIDISQFNLSYERFLLFFELFTNCPILKLFCNLYKITEILPEKDYKYDLEQKVNEIDRLKQAIKILQPISEKPEKFEQDLIKSMQRRGH